ncbi:hypothetical protein ABZ470_40690 [Streptosporangium sp. NPDC020072]|uniref:hypothetical protein n=1 Tax=Streptosporangium sp. NPDC020072 TaxID=3154788 RepID=UPI003443BC23
MQDTRTEPVKVYESPLVAEVGAFAVTTFGSLDPNRRRAASPTATKTTTETDRRLGAEKGAAGCAGATSATGDIAGPCGG